MNIYSHLHAEHVQIKTIMDEIEQCGYEDDDKKFVLFEELSNLLLMHAKAEEKAFYERLKDIPEMQRMIEQSQTEHEEAQKYLHELSDPELVGAAWQKKFLSLKTDVESHIKEEESGVFKMAKDRVGATVENTMEDTMELEERVLSA